MGWRLVSSAPSFEWPEIWDPSRQALRPSLPRVGIGSMLGEEGTELTEQSVDGNVIYPLAWAQGVGCGIMGLALARKNEIILM